MKMDNYPDGVSTYTKGAPWNVNNDDICYSLLEEAQEAATALTEALESLRDHDRRWYFRAFGFAYKHDNPLSALDELEAAIQNEIDYMDEPEI